MGVGHEAAATEMDAAATSTSTPDADDGGFRAFSQRGRSLVDALGHGSFSGSRSL
jgi:hypothetical protein